MSKFKIGDKVVPSPEYEGAVNTHPWLVDGAIYTITSVTSSGDWVNIEGVFTKQANPHTKGTDWSVGWFELYEEKETEMTAEQIHNEIIRIDSRIEEANKDIEKAQEERNSLVEKLREKGFTLIGEIPPLSNKPFLEIGAVYIVNSSDDANTYFGVGTEVTLIDTVECSSLNVLVEQGEGERDWMNSKGLTKI